MKRQIIAAVIVLLSGCSSGTAPGSGDVLSQVNKAYAVEVEAALRNASVAEEAHFAQQGTYTTDIQALGVNPGPNVVLTVVRADATDFCIEGTHERAADALWHVSKGGAPSQGAC
ncbi:MAG: hypothetical protein ACRDJJ_09090 [Actinomycetota bacterium]